MLPMIVIPQQDMNQNQNSEPSQHNASQSQDNCQNPQQAKKQSKQAAHHYQKQQEITNCFIKNSSHQKAREHLKGKGQRLNSSNFYINKLLDNNYYAGLMTLITLYALFGDDIRVIATEKDEDPYFWGFSSFAFAAFMIEIALSSIAKEGYFLGFFFWLDLLSTLSLILDIGWIANEIFDINSGNKGKASSAASLAKASRASRVGTKAGRIVRVVRLIRLVRLYKHAQQALHKQAKEFEMEQLKLRAQQQQEGNRDRSESKDSSFQNYQSPHGGPSVGSASVANQQPKAITPQNLHTLRPPTLPPGAFDMRGNSHTNRNREKKQTMNSEQARQQKQSTFLQSVRRGQSRSTSKVLPFSMAQEMVQQNSGNPSLPVIAINNSNTENHVDNDVAENREKSISIRSLPQMRSRNISSSSNKSGGSNSSSTRSFNVKNVPSSETKVGKTLSDLTTQRVILIVLLILISQPLFNVNTYIEAKDSFAPSLQLIYKSEKMSDGAFDNTVSNFINVHKDGNIVVTCVSSIRDNNVINAILSIVRTVFVAVVLTFGAVQFNKDVEEYILEPIEKMLKKVTRISENPLEAAQMEEKEEFAIEQLKNEGNEKELAKIKEQSTYETVVLEKLIIRIGALLALGFGEAGSEIIAQNMSKSGEVDPMLPGKKMMAVFGFCDIRNFTDATEVLQTGVMVFVNEIAQITHSVVDQYCGQANKNIGDAFLLVWKFREQDYLRNIDGTMEFLPNDITSNYADLSVISFLKIMSGITLSNGLKKYKHHAGLKARLRGYRVKMGFGLHFGWAIEGAIGSAFKIDASYLSPNVNMASRLEAATKQFGVGLLISGPLRNILSEKCQSHLRQIDCVTVKGSVVPLDLYTVDVSLERLYAKRKGKDLFDFSNFTYQQQKKKKIVDRMKRNHFKADVLKGTTRVADQFDKDLDLIEMRKEYSQDFYKVWNQALESYLSGRWFECSVHLKQTLSWFRDRQDGPSQTLMEYIKEYNYMCPRDWRGFRMLTEK